MTIEEKAKEKSPYTKTLGKKATIYGKVASKWVQNWCLKK